MANLSPEKTFATLTQGAKDRGASPVEAFTAAMKVTAPQGKAEIKPKPDTAPPPPPSTPR